MMTADVVEAPGAQERKWWRWIISDTAARYTSRIMILALWQLAAVLFDRIPTPGGTARFLVEEFQRGEIIPNLFVSVKRTVLSLLVVLVLGVLAGFAMARWWRIRYLLSDLMLVGIALPAFIWALLGVMWWGFSNVAPIMVCIFSATPQLLVNTYEGARSTPASLTAMSDSYGVPTRKQFRWLILPSMMEYIVSGFRFAILAGWGSVLLVEWFGNNMGAGYRAHFWYDAGNFDGLMGWGLMMTAVIMTFDRLVMERVVRRFRRYRVGRREWSG